MITNRFEPVRSGRHNKTVGNRFSFLSILHASGNAKKGFQTLDSTCFHCWVCVYRIHQRLLNMGVWQRVAGLPKVLLRTAMPYISTSCGQATPETGLRWAARLRGRWLRPSSTPLEIPRRTPMLVNSAIVFWNSVMSSQRNFLVLSAPRDS
jgi:hypothetical protein